MPDIRFPALALTLATAPTLAAEPQQSRTAPAPPPRMTVTSVTVQQRMVIRVPRLPIGRTPIAGAATALPPLRWSEKKTGKCVPVGQLAAATIAGPDSVDLLLNGGKRIRARFDDDCRALDFYSGFYVKMPSDGNVCASRDVIHSRSGGECRIRSFRALVPTR